MTVWVDDLVSNQTSAVAFDTLRTNGFTGTYVCNGTVAPGFLTNYYLHGMDIGSHLVDHTCQILDEPTFRQEIEPNIAGIKDSSGNRELFASYMPAQSTTFSVLNGNGQMWHHALTVGSRGGILAVALFAAALSMEVYDAEQRGDVPLAEQEQEGDEEAGTHAGLPYSPKPARG